MNIIKFCLLLVCLNFVVSCGQIDIDSPISDRLSNTIFTENTNSNLSEVAPPKIVKQLNQVLEQYAPQVEIITPQAQQIFNQTEVSVQLQVEDLPIFQDEKLNLGNHLNLILDNEAAQPIYDLEQPVILKNLSPGTHSIRVFASRPWGESFKNEGAYAQTTFSVLTETNDNRPDSNLPLLTYGNPTGTYGAEPFLLDFYLTNAPLHSVAKNNPNLKDWRIKATIDGESFIVENWQAIYLTGLNPGENWIQLELIDETGKPIENTFNNTVRVINYDPQQQDTLAKLVTNQISLDEAQSIVEHNYYIQPIGEPEIIEPTVETEEPKSTEADVIDETIEPVEGAIVEDEKNTETFTVDNTFKSEPAAVNPITKADRENDISAINSQDLEEVQPEARSEQPITTSAPATAEIEVAMETTQDSLKESTKPKPVIITTEENSDTSSETIGTIKISQPESVEITEDEIAITIPNTESSKTNTLPNIETKTPVWWKKLLVTVRQKLENLVKLLPSKA